MHLTMALMLGRFVTEFAAAIAAADARQPQWVSTTSGKTYAPGIGPHTETQTVLLAMAELKERSPSLFADYRVSVPYPAKARQKCDLVLRAEGTEWALEIKMLRFMGDNGKPNDNILMHILSPYPAHRSAVTDTTKLLNSGFTGRKGIVIYGFDYPLWPMDPAIESFELLASARVRLGPRETAGFDNLVHPIHQRGRVFGWEVTPTG